MKKGCIKFFADQKVLILNFYRLSIRNASHFAVVVNQTEINAMYNTQDMFYSSILLLSLYRIEN